MAASAPERKASQGLQVSSTLTADTTGENAGVFPCYRPTESRPVGQPRQTAL